MSTKKPKSIINKPKTPVARSAARTTKTVAGRSSQSAELRKLRKQLQVFKSENVFLEKALTRRLVEEFKASGPDDDEIERMRKSGCESIEPLLRELEEVAKRETAGLPQLELMRREVQFAEECRDGYIQD